MEIEPVHPDALYESLGSVDPANSVLLASASYESRSLAIAHNLPDECHFRLGMVYAHREGMEGPAGEVTKANFESLQALLEQRCDHVVQAVGSWLDPIVQLGQLQTLVSKAEEHVAVAELMQVHVDATTFTREALVVSCALFRRQTCPAAFRVLYATPVSHGTWLSRGFRCVRNIMGFAGHQIPGLPSVLVILSGFEAERTIRVIDEHEPSLVLLGLGDPPVTKSLLERNLKEQELVLARQDVKRFYFPANSVEKCARRLASVIEPLLKGHNVIVAPMSTKLSTIAAMIVAEEIPAVQLTYCVPGEYNTESYSEGLRSVFIEEL